MKSPLEARGSVWKHVEACGSRWNVNKLTQGTRKSLRRHLFTTKLFNIHTLTQNKRVIVKKEEERGVRLWAHIYNMTHISHSS